MPITIKAIKPVSLQEFMDEHGLELIVREIRPSYVGEVGSKYRWHADFKGAEVKQGGMLAGKYGSHEVQGEAIKDYCRQIEGELLVIDAYQSTRREIRVPDKLYWAGSQVDQEGTP